MQRSHTVGRLRLSALALGSIAAMAACADTPTATSPGDAAGPNVLAARAQARRLAQANLDAAVRGRRVRGIEDEILRLESEDAGIGGVYYDADAREFVMFARDDAPAPRADAVAKKLADRLGGTRQWAELASLKAGHLRIRHGDYAFSELVAWQTQLVSALFGMDGLVGIDANEGLNRVSVAVATSAARADVLRAAASLGIPDGAIELRELPPGRSFSDLNQEVRPTAGGYRITNWDNDASCSLGYNVTGYPGAIEGMITASHCANNGGGGGLFSSTTWWIYQHVKSDNSPNLKIGSVTGNPLWPTSCTLPDGSTHLGYCPVADAMFVTSINPQLRRVAKTADIQNTSKGSLTVVGMYDQITNPAVSVQGTYVMKTGRTTGTTQGPVSATCAFVPISDPQLGSVMHQCVDRVDGAAAGAGDSGGPVYAFAQPVSFQIVEPRGIVVGGAVNRTDGPGAWCGLSSSCWYIYAPWSAIETHLGMTLDPKS